MKTNYILIRIPVPEGESVEEARQLIEEMSEGNDLDWVVVDVPTDEEIINEVKSIESWTTPNQRLFYRYGLKSMLRILGL